MALINKPGRTITVSASAARSSHHFVDLSGGYPAASGDAVGVIQSDHASGDKMTVVTEGIVPVVADGAITAGAWVQATSAGKAITQTTGFGVARALTSAGDGELVSVQLAMPKEAYSTYGVVALGSAVLVAGTKTVSTTAIKAGDKVILTRLVTGGTVGHLSVGTIVDATSFVINSDSATETSTIAWAIVR